MTGSELNSLFRLDKALVASRLVELVARDLVSRKAAAVYKLAAEGHLPGNGRLTQFGVTVRADIVLLIDEVEDAFREAFPNPLAEGCE